MTKRDIARTAYNVNAAYCWSIGDHSFGPWEDAPEWQKNSCRLGVDFYLGNPKATPADAHKVWLAAKEVEGWQYGTSKNETLRQHPCMVPFHELPREQVVKDFLFKAVVDSLRHLLRVPGD